MIMDNDAVFLQSVFDDTVSEYEKCCKWLNTKAVFSDKAIVKGFKNRKKHLEERVVAAQAAINKHQRKLTEIAKAGGVNGQADEFEEAFDFVITHLTREDWDKINESLGVGQ